MRPLDRVRYRPVVAQRSPLAKKEEISVSELEGLTELRHRDVFYAESKAGLNGNRNYCKEECISERFRHGVVLEGLYIVGKPDPLWYIQTVILLKAEIKSDRNGYKGKNNQQERTWKDK